MLKQPRFVMHTNNSFFGNFLYDSVVPKSHFLRQAKQLINWQSFTDRCLVWYKGSGKDGRPPYEPAMLLRILLVSYLFNMSERLTEEAVNLNLAMKYFVGLGVDELAPDHSSLTRFKERLLKGGGQTAYDQLLQDIIREAQRLGVKFGQVQVIDATHTIADVNIAKDDDRKKTGRAPRDPDAKWGVKRIKKVKDIKGKTRKIPDYFHGYKAHTSVNANSRLITSIKPTSGEAPDGKQFQSLVNKDRFVPGLTKRRTYTADKAYDDGDNHEYLKEKKLGDGITLNNYRTNKKNPNKAPWLTLQASQTYQQSTKLRKTIESIFGSNKTGHGLRRCRYLGLSRFGVQAKLTAVAWNLSVVVATMTGSTLRGYAYGGAGAWSSP